ncbi:acyl carrier protein [Pendulispora albinea]|uniref:Acyl carrier protein n=1 Tax=Pendulispora albinea TaxID=2741071 RepID=A0ABZ2LYY3_9BACT
MKESLLSSVAKRLGLKEAPRGAPLRSEAEIRRWMTDRLAAQLKIPVDNVDTSREFASYGLDSRTAIQVSGELEKAVERRLSPALLFEHPTIDSVARELARELSHENKDD